MCIYIYIYIYSNNKCMCVFLISPVPIAEPLTSELIDTPVLHNLAPRPIKYRVSVPIPNSERLDLLFLENKKLLWGSTKALNVAKLATLHASLLLTSFSLSDCSSTRDAFVNAHTHIQEYLDCGQSEGGSALHYL